MRIGNVMTNFSSIFQDKRKVLLFKSFLQSVFYTHHMPGYNAISLEGIFGVAIHGFLPILRKVPKGILAFCVIMIEVDVVARGFLLHGITALVRGHRLAYDIGEVLHENSLQLSG